MSSPTTHRSEVPWPEPGHHAGSEQAASSPISSEVDTDEPAVGVTISWGDESVLDVAHLRPSSRFVVGGSPSSDFVVGEDLLGTPEMVIALDAGAHATLVIPMHATGWVSVGARTRSLSELRAEEAPVPCTDVAQAMKYRLPPTATARISIRPLTFVIRPTPEARRVGAEGPGVQWDRDVWMAASFALHGVLVLMFALMPAHAPALAADLHAPDLRLARLLLQARELDAWAATIGPRRTPSPTDGEAAPIGERSDARIGAPALHISSALEVEQAGPARTIRRLQQASRAWSAASSGYSASPAGAYAYGMRTPGAFRGHDPGEDIGARGRVSTGDVQVRGGYPREAVRRVVRRHLNEVRFCYEQDLVRHPDLAGRVVVTFVISSTGDVQTAALASSTLGRASVEACVSAAVRRWSFPEPEGGRSALVSYPFVFAPHG